MSCSSAPSRQGTESVGPWLLVIGDGKAPFDGTATRSCEDLTSAGDGAVVAVAMRSECGASSLSLVEELSMQKLCSVTSVILYTSPRCAQM